MKGGRNLEGIVSKGRANGIWRMEFQVYVLIGGRAMKGGWNLEDVNSKGRVHVDCPVKNEMYAGWRANNEERVHFGGRERATWYIMYGMAWLISR